MSNQNIIPYHLRSIASESVVQQGNSLLRNNRLNIIPLVDDGLERLEPADFTIENLREHLRIAMTLELSTIPPYLCALYSLQTGDSTQPDYRAKYGDNIEVSFIVRSVMMEEMLHFTLVGNILNAVGGEIKINNKDYVPVYPTTLPHSDGAFDVSLRKFDRTAISTFLKIEQPTAADAEPELEGYSTIGQFYSAIELLMEVLEAEAKVKKEKTGEGNGTIFTGAAHLQISEEYFYGGGDEKIVFVNDLCSAKDALKIIVEQGEGTEHNIHDGEVEDGIAELAHYFKFNEIYEGRRYADCQRNPKEPPQGAKLDVKYDRVYNMLTNPKTAGFVSEDLMLLSDEFNLFYRELLDNLQISFEGHPDQLIKAVGDMYKLKYKAIELMRNPIPCQRVNAGPTFEFLNDERVEEVRRKLKEREQFKG